MEESPKNFTIPKLPTKTRVANMLHKNFIRGIIVVSIGLAIIDTSLIKNFFDTKEDRVSRMPLHTYLT